MNNQVLAAIKSKLCYTPLVFERVNKKLDLNQDEAATKALVNHVLAQPDGIDRRGKNYYVQSRKYQVELTVNASNYRLITVNRISEV
ncbi:DUF3781 domain-containing protein [Lactiplantibacillus carotarum]|uniref:DUF3781 domain-containing protein n=1 Tax=Lactiplantibacillus carotarum TaxID=2993456 RepID=UPI00298EE3CD|nr:DUF3781 domain-containing protein [Lactiplantibacillus carotarum]